MMRRPLPVTLVAGVLVLAGCGADSSDDTASRESPSVRSTSTPRTSATTRPTTTAPTTEATLSPEDEARFVATFTANSFAENSEVLSMELVKSNSLVEAQTDFRFDEPGRTLILAVSSTFNSDRHLSELAYDLATDFAPVYWGPEATDVVRPESLVSFSVTVDAASYLCNGPTMAALVDRELSMEMFVQQCGV
jgi:hypothetical protein